MAEWLGDTPIFRRSMTERERTEFEMFKKGTIMTKTAKTAPKTAPKTNPQDKVLALKASYEQAVKSARSLRKRAK